MIWNNGASQLVLAGALAGVLVTGDGPPPPPPAPGDWEGVGTAELTVTLTVEQVHNFSPSAVHLYTNVSGSAYTSPITFGAGRTGMNANIPALHRQHVVVHTGDTGHYDTPRMPFSSWTDKAFQYGQIAKHVYHGDGAYEVRSYVYDDDGKWGVSSPQTITVVPTTDFAASSRRVVVSNDPSETWADAPAHDVDNRCTTLVAGFNRVGALKGGGRVELILHSGQTFNENINVGNNLRDYTGDYFFMHNRWGNAGRAVINDRAAGGTHGGAFFGFNFATNPHMVCSGIDWILDWDAVTNINGAAGSDTILKRRGLITLGDGNDSNITFADCSVTGFNIGFQFANQKDNRQFFLSNFRFIAGQDYAIFGDEGRLALLGVSYEMPNGYALGNGGRNRHEIQHIFQAHSGIRGSYAHEFYIRAHAAWMRHGWAGNDDARFQYNNQPLWRMNASIGGPARGDKIIYVADSTFEGSMFLNGSGSTFFPNCIMENSLVIRSPTQILQDYFQGVTPRTTFRNVTFVQFDTPDQNFLSIPSRNASRWGHNIGIGSNGPVMQMLAGTPPAGSEVAILHCQFINLRGAARGVSSINRYTVPSGWTVVDNNSINYAPNIASPEIPAGGVVTTQWPFTVHDGFFRWVYERGTYTLASAVNNGATTPTLAYPTDWYNNATTQASYAGTQRRHAIWAFAGGVYGTGNAKISASPGDANLNQGEGHFTVNFLSGGFTITNTSGANWPSGTLLEVILDRGTTLMATDYHPDYAVPAAQQSLFRVATNVAADAGRTTLFDMARNRRPGAGYAISPTGTNCKGPLLPAP